MVEDMSSKERARNNIVVLAFILFILTFIIEGFFMTTAYGAITNQIDGTSAFYTTIQTMESQELTKLISQANNDETLTGFAENLETTQVNTEALDEFERNVNIPNFIKGMGLIFWLITEGWIMTSKTIIAVLIQMGFLGSFIIIALYLPILYTIMRAIFGSRV